MARIRGWKKVGDWKLLKRYVNVKAGRILEIVKDGYMKGSPWKVHTGRRIGQGGRVTLLHKSKNLSNATKWAISWMKKHPNG